MQIEKNEHGRDINVKHLNPWIITFENMVKD